MRGGIAVAVIVCALAASASAQDACLTGASTLADQRAIADLRAATEANCPCASYSAPRGRNAFRRCARLETKAALQAGTLRRECLRTARNLYRGATCGSNRIACGGFESDDLEVTCRLAAPTGDNQCAGKPGRVETACNAQTHCADVFDWTAGTCVDPRALGPYGVGVRIITYTKDSVVTPGTPRPLNTYIWYPIAPGSGPIDPPLRGVINAPLDNSGGPYPLLMFSHGSCGYPYQSLFLMTMLASNGIIVASPPHPGNTIFELPACASGQAQVASAQERPNDIIFVTDELLAANEDSGSPFFGAIDPDRIGIGGHSFGGFTTYLVSARDSRYRIAMPMAPAALGNPTLTVPSLTLLGEIDSVVNNDQTRAAYDRSSMPKLQVTVNHAGHYAFSDACFPSADCNPPVTLTQDEAHAAVQRWVLPFVKRYLAGDASYEPFFASSPPGVAVRQER